MNPIRLPRLLHTSNPARSSNSAILLLILLNMTGFWLIFPLLPFYAQTLQAGPTSIGMLFAALPITQLVFSIVIGRVSDKTGRKPALLTSLLISCISFILFAFANNLAILLLSVITAGMGMILTVAQAYISDTTTNSQRTGAIGKLIAAAGIGQIIGSAAGGLLSNISFSAPSILGFILALISLLLALFILPEPKRSIHPSTSPESSSPRRLRHNLKTGPVTTALTILVASTFAFGALPVIMPLLAQQFFGYKVSEMSYIFMYIGLLQVIVQGVIIGRLSKKLGDCKLVTLGTIPLIIGVAAFPMISSPINFLFCVTMASIGFGLILTAVPSFISQKTPPTDQGSAMGLTQSASSLGQIPGAMFGGFIFEFAGLSVPFLLSAALIFAALCASYRRIRK